MIFFYSFEKKNLNRFSFILYIYFFFLHLFSEYFSFSSYLQKFLQHLGQMIINSMQQWVNTPVWLVLPTVKYKCLFFIQGFLLLQLPLPKFNLPSFIDALLIFFYQQSCPDLTGNMFYVAIV